MADPGSCEPPPDSGLPLAEFAFPGALRDRLVAAILDGRKVSTTCLAVEFQIEDEPLPRPGDRSVVVDSGNRPVAVIEVTQVSVVPISEVDLAHAVDEGEGHASVEAWRRDHEAFWHSAEVRAALGDPAFEVTDSTLVVLQRFNLTKRLG